MHVRCGLARGHEAEEETDDFAGRGVLSDERRLGEVGAEEQVDRIALLGKRRAVEVL